MADTTFHRLIERRETLLAELRDMFALGADGIDRSIAARIRDNADRIALTNEQLAMFKINLDARRYAR